MESKHTVWEMMDEEELRREVRHCTYYALNVGDSVMADVYRQMAENARKELARREQDDSHTTSNANQ
jgi:hypothetical protein